MIIDANVQFGFDLAEGIPCAKEDLNADMEQRGVDACLLTNLRCQRGDFVQGNQETYQAVLTWPERFRGLIAYSATRYYSIEQTVRQYLAKKEFVGVRFFNTDSSFMSGWGTSLQSLGMRATLKDVHLHRKLVFLEGGYNIADVHDLCAAYPEIPFIVSGVGYMNLAEAIYAAKAQGNIYYETSTLDAFEGIKTLCNEIGPDRLLFGSGWPYTYTSCSHIMIENAGISAQATQLIMGGNLLHLLEGLAS